MPELVLSLSLKNTLVGGKVDKVSIDEVRRALEDANLEDLVSDIDVDVSGRPISNVQIRFKVDRPEKIDVTELQDLEQVARALVGGALDDSSVKLVGV